MSVFRYLDTEELEVRNPLFLLHTESDNTFTDIHDIGFVGQYYDGANIVYTGLFRDASDSGKYKLFESLQVLPTVDTGVVNTAGAGYALASLDLQNLNASGNVVITGDLTVNGTTTAVNAETLLVEDNIIVANTAVSKEDAGFVVRRPAAAVGLDTPKIATVAVDTTYVSGTTLLIANAATGTDYFKGWVIGNSVNGEKRLITASTEAAGVHTLTLDSGFTTGLTAGTDTVNLYNKQYVGTIWDESTDLITLYGFPREDTMGVISTTGDAGNGNLADFMSLKAQDVNANGAVTAVGNISSSTGSVSAATSVTAGTTVIAGTGITSTTGNITASAGGVSANTTVTAGTSITAGTTITAGTGLTVTTGNLSVASGNATISGSVTAGSYAGSMAIDDNILAINQSTLEDGGFVTRRSPANIVAQDTPLVSGTASASGTTTTIELAAGPALALDYYKGWILQLGVTSTETVTVTSSSTASPPVLTFTPAASVATDNTTTYQLFNGVYAGSMWDESTNTLNMISFPREIGETQVIPLTNPSGNVGSYLNVAVNNLTVNGSFNLVGGTTLSTKTQVAAVTFLASDILNFEIIYLNPSSNTTYTLPTLASLSLAANTSKIIIFVNINATNKATIARNGSNTIEGLLSLNLTKQWSKTVLVASDQQPSTWMIKG